MIMKENILIYHPIFDNSPLFYTNNVNIVNGNTFSNKNDLRDKFNLITSIQFSSQNAYPIQTKTLDRLQHTHEKIIRDIPEYTIRSCVKGDYAYFHYGQDNFNDKVRNIFNFRAGVVPIDLYKHNFHGLL